MRKLPIPAQVYLVAVCVLAAVASVLMLRLPWAVQGFGGWELAAFLLLAVFAGGKKIPLSRKSDGAQSGSLTLGFAITLATLIENGPAAALLIAVVSCISSCVYPKRQPAHQVTFNAAMSALEAIAGSFVYHALKAPTLHGYETLMFAAVIASSLAFFTVNTVGVATIISLCSKIPTSKIWRENFMWTAPSYLAVASVTGLATFLFHSSFAGTLLFVAPVMYLVYQTYVAFITRAEEKERHIEELQISQAHLADLYLATIKSLALAIDAKDQYTHQHILRVQRYSVAIANQMGLQGAELEAVNTGALLHDIGKLGVPEYVLLKPGRLTAEEFDKIKKHPEIGEAILDPVEFPWPVLPVVRHHHEKWDGTGYPDGLKAEEIPLTARIMAVADVYDALTSTRSYRNAWTHERAVEVIKKDVGTHFDKQVVEAFVQVIDGVVKQMAEEGEGPLVPKKGPEKEASRAAQAAKDISRASTELWALYEVAQTLTASLGTQDTVDYLARKIERIFQGSLCTFLLKGQEGRLEVRTAVGLNSSFFAGAYSLGDRSRSVQVLRSAKTYSGEYDPDDLLLSAVEGSPWAPLNSAVIVPLVVENEEVGTLNCYHPDDTAFSDYDIHLLETVGEKASLAIYNSILFDRTRGHALTDPLTGAFNVRYLTDYLDDKCNTGINGASGERFSLLCMDLDCFKPINDNFGHHKGDAVLCELTRIFASVVGLNDVIVRYGGDEFMIVAVGADRSHAATLADKLQLAVAEFNPKLVHPTFGELRLGVTVGVASYPESAVDCAGLIAAADSDMCRLKMEKKLRGLSVSREPSTSRSAA